MYSIGLLSKKSGVKVPTLRFYEDIGLIDPPHRSVGNQRRYEASTLERVNFIRHARRLGFSIDSIREFIALSKTPTMSCSTAHEIAQAQLMKIEQKIAELKDLQLELERIAALGDDNADGTIGQCKVFEALNNHEFYETEH